MRRNYLISSALFYFMLSMASCSTNSSTFNIAATNPSDFARKAETIEIPLKSLTGFSREQYEDLFIEDTEGREIPIQLIDTDQDAIDDLLIFQTDLGPGQVKEFALTVKRSDTSASVPAERTFCRIVPERMDDFAWENDKVAFRTYGPECQELFEAGDPAGLISSGIDCWTKRVDYPIIDKWYSEDKNGKSYHVDHGEGLDAYHVGTTRGCGGTALVGESEYILSENFNAWKVLANGPVRSVFELKYPPVSMGNATVVERKRITLDLGAHLYHCEVSYTSQSSVDLAAVGIALHQGLGRITSNTEEGWVSYWEPYGDSYLGTAILAGPEAITNVEAGDTLYQDESLNNIWVHMKVRENRFNYWSGFGWHKSGLFDSAEDWEDYLKKESFKRRDPVQVKITKN